ncbi:MAG TPA: hypothetical protein VNR89_13835 [Roseomonas sp.]|nr:hypothetical protein [Roseomonas sp.]
MSDTTADACMLSTAPAAGSRPSPAKGLLWGGALSIPLWAAIGWVAARLF